MVGTSFHMKISQWKNCKLFLKIGCFFYATFRFWLLILEWNVACFFVSFTHLPASNALAQKKKTKKNKKKENKKSAVEASNSALWQYFCNYKTLLPKFSLVSCRKMALFKWFQVFMHHDTSWIKLKTYHITIFFTVI